MHDPVVVVVFSGRTDTHSALNTVCDVYRAEQRCVVWAHCWLPCLFLFLSLTRAVNRGLFTVGKLALTSLWVRVSKCCSHYKCPRDDMLTLR